VIGIGPVGLLLILAIAGLYVASIVWAYRDAEQRGKNGLLVALLAALVTWPLGLLVWVLIRPTDGA
jgi:hypothetical protein